MRWRSMLGHAPRWRVTVVLVVGALLLGTAVVAVRALVRTPVDDVAAEIGGWEAATYRGVLTDALGETTTVDLTVSENGPAYGVFERSSGARAQVVLDGGQTRTRADRAWWRAVGAPEVLAGAWVADPFGLPAQMVADGVLEPSRVADELTSDDVGPWTAAGERVVDDRRGRVFTAGTEHEVVVGADGEAAVLWLSIPLVAPPGRDRIDRIVDVAGFTVTRPSDGELERLRAYTAAVAAVPEGGRECPPARVVEC